MIDAIIVMGYVALLVWLSLRGGNGIAGGDEFAGGGRTYGSFVIFASLSASYVGGGYSSGNASETFATGIGTTVALLGFSVSMVAVGLFIAPRVGRFTGIYTVGGIMEKTYGKSARILTGLFAFLCCAGVVGAQMETMGVVFHSLLGISPTLGILLGGGVVLLYSTFGGMRSVIVADILQFLLLAVGMPLLLCGALQKAGGLTAVLHAVPANRFSVFSGRTPIEFLSLCGTLALGEALAPPYTQRLLIGKNPRVTARGTVLSGLFSAPFFLITAAVGLCALALEVTSQPAEAMPALIKSVLPVGVRGVVMAAMVSIMLSSSDSFLNSASVSLVSDTIERLTPLSEQKRLRYMRLVNLLTGLTAMVAAFVLPDVFSILSVAYSFWCPLILIPLCAAFFGVDSTETAFLGGVAAGVLVIFLWTLCRNPFGLGADMAGLLANAAVFSALTRRHQSCRKIRKI